MKILAIDSSGLVASVALLIDDVMVGEYTIHNKKTHSQTLLPMLEAMLEMADVSIKEMDGIAVAAGPGSFTGLRIGAATAKGLAGALNVPIFSVPTLEALAFNVAGTAGVVCPLMDARRQQAYYGVYRVTDNKVEVISPQNVCGIEDIIEIVNNIKEPVTFLGDGVVVFREQLQADVNVPLSFATTDCNCQKAGSVAVLGMRLAIEEKGMQAKDFVPEYIRLSQAEREKMEKENKRKRDDVC